MTDEAAFRAAILNEPAETIHRLVYADWLDEAHNTAPKRAALAEFVRVQCDIARGPCFALVARPSYHSDVYTNAGGNVSGNIQGNVVGGTASVVGHVGGNVTGSVGDMVYESCGACERCRGGFAALHSRQAALLKKWGGGWLAKPLRGGYPHFRVEGNLVHSDPLGGYLRFERGFVAHMYRELPRRPDMVVASAVRFAELVQKVFRHNPLTGFTISFEHSSVALRANIGPQTMGDGTVWVVGWDYDTQKRRPEVFSNPVGNSRVVGTRAALVGDIAGWLRQAIVRSAEVAAREAEEQEAVNENYDPSYIPTTNDDETITF